MKKTPLVVIIIVLIIVAAIAFFAYNHRAAAPATPDAVSGAPGVTTTVPTTPAGTPGTVTAPAPTFSWKFTAVGNANDGKPETRVTVTTGDKPYEAGTYAGSCSIMGQAGVNSQPLSAGELAGVMCWFAGGGNEVGIFRESGKLVIKSRIVDEGTAEGPGASTPFVMVKTLN